MADRPDHNTGSSDSQDSQDLQGKTGTAPPAPLSFAEASCLDLQPFIVWAIDNGHRYEDQEWGTPIFSFTRLVRSWRKEQAKADRAFEIVDEVMRKWNGWSKYFALTDEEAYAQFVETWPKVRWRIDESPLDIAAKRAKAFPLASHVKRARPTPGYNRFFSLVGWLQFTMARRRTSTCRCARSANASKRTSRWCRSGESGPSTTASSKRSSRTTTKSGRLPSSASSQDTTPG